MQNCQNPEDLSSNSKESIGELLLKQKAQKQATIHDELNRRYLEENTSHEITKDGHVCGFEEYKTDPETGKKVLTRCKMTYK